MRNSFPKAYDPKNRICPGREKTFVPGMRAVKGQQRETGKTPSQTRWALGGTGCWAHGRLWDNGAGSGRREQEGGLTLTVVLGVYSLAIFFTLHTTVRDITASFSAFVITSSISQVRKLRLRDSQTPNTLTVMQQDSSDGTGIPILGLPAPFPQSYILMTLRSGKEFLPLF